MAEKNLKNSNSNDSAAASKPDNEPDHNVEQDSDVTDRQKEIGGRDGPDPTRYGDWEKNGRCVDF
jgi:hypothetical protein